MSPHAQLMAQQVQAQAAMAGAYNPRLAIGARPFAAPGGTPDRTAGATPVTKPPSEFSASGFLPPRQVPGEQQGAAAQAPRPDTAPRLTGPGSLLYLRSALSNLDEFCKECVAIRDRAEASQADQVALVREGVAKVVCVGMGVHRGSVAAQELGCEVLCALAHGEECERRIAAEGAFEVVAAAMRLHATHPGVNEHCCAVIACIGNEPEAKVRMRGPIKASPAAPVRQFARSAHAHGENAQVVVLFTAVCERLPIELSGLPHHMCPRCVAGAHRRRRGRRAGGGGSQGAQRACGAASGRLPAATAAKPGWAPPGYVAV